MAWQLVGRDVELGFVTSAIANNQGVVLAGAAGVGKTRLAREALARVDAGSRSASWFVATRAAASIPFGAVAELIPESSFEPTNSARVLLAVRDRVIELAGGVPFVVGLDDAHLADDATAALVHLLALRGDATVVVTVRTGEPAPDAIRALWKDGLCARLEGSPGNDGADGLDGSDGAPGPAGPSDAYFADSGHFPSVAILSDGTYHVVVSRSLPPGNYALTATAVLQDDDHDATIDCFVTGGDYTRYFTSVGTFAGFTPTQNAKVTQIATTSFPSGGSAELKCATPNDADGLVAWSGRILAIKVGDIH
jgi:hypothetical protein